MEILIKEPTKAYLIDFTEQDIRKLASELTFKNTSIQFQLSKLNKNRWFKQKDYIAWEKAKKDLEAKVKTTLLFEDEDGVYIRPGSVSYLENKYIVRNEVKYPEPRLVPWKNKIPYELYNYQKQSIKKLIENKHAAVSLCTGAGKSYCIIGLCKEMGLKTAVVAPSRAIFKELLEKMEYHFGKNLVGAFGDGKKKIGKQYTVCIGDSLCNIKEGSKEWEFFSNLDVLIVDESHSWGSETLEEVCHGVFKMTPYRFFLSATQTRGDGGIKLLQSITGEIVHSLTTQEAVTGGYICPHNFKIINIPFNKPKPSGSDPLTVKREDFLRNKDIARFTTKFANAMAKRGEQTLILVEELGQIASVIKNLETPFVYAHSESDKNKLSKLGLDKVDISDSVDKFNKGEAMVLIGTSCLHVGVNIYPMRSTINWIGGTSEIKTKQAAIGRSIRLGSANPYKNNVNKDIVTIYDFNITPNEILERHLIGRLECYNESGEGLVEAIDFK